MMTSQPVYKHHKFFEQEMNFISELIFARKAYVISIPEKGNYVCMQSSFLDEKRIKKMKPIENKDVHKTFLQNPLDFVIWNANDVNGYLSPWGKGLPSANLHVLVINASMCRSLRI